jgi:probable H4MPT-linked C1 transfer pathway protein
MKNAIMGWDIGGAHVKAALVCDGAPRWAMQLPCPLWLGMGHLETAIVEALAAAKQQCGLTPEHHAVTMTGELVDLFASREQGVQGILDVMTSHLPKLQVFAGNSGFVSPQEAAHRYAQVASANWLATASALQRLCKADECVLLIDIGSTTTDIIPLTHRGVHALGHDDFTRLAHDELLYTGCARTPLMALAQRLVFEEQTVNVMAEYFATMADVYRLTGELDEASDQHAAADNGAKTMVGSARRLARMIGRDRESASIGQWRGLAAQFAQLQRDLIIASLDRVLARVRVDHSFSQPHLVLTGSGAFIGEQVAWHMGFSHERLSKRLQISALADADTCVPAIAVALLASHP